MDWTKKSHFMKLPEKLLIVEHDVEQAGTLWDHFRQEGYAPLVAFSTEDARLLIDQEQPGLILLSWSLPDASGWSLLDELRIDPSMSRLRIVVLGEQNKSEEECIRALEAGADNYIRRPIGFRELLARIKAVLRLLPRRVYMQRLKSVGKLTLDLDAHRVLADLGSTRWPD
jgi:DNA-binding response OmpR family regulator